MRHNDIASGLLALCEYTSLAHVHYFLLQIVFPSTGTELVAAAQLNCTTFLVVRLEFHIHDFAHIFIFGCCGIIDVRILLNQFLVVVEAYFDSELVLISEPLIFELLLVPLEVPQH